MIERYATSQGGSGWTVWIGYWVQGFRPYIQGGNGNLWYYDGILQLKVPIRKKS